MNLYQIKRPNREFGQIVYMGVVIFSLMYVSLVYLNDHIVRNRKDVELRIKLDGLALNISEAGLFETLAQFRNKGSMDRKRIPERDGGGQIVIEDGITQYLSDENFVNFGFEWTCRNVAIGCTKVLEEPFNYEINYPEQFVDHSDDICEICTAAGREQKGFYIPQSEEPKIGIVRNFDVNGKTALYDPISGQALNELGDLKVRYEVWERMVEDYTQETGFDSQDSGRVWVARSVGIVYRVIDDGTGNNLVESLSTVVQTRMYKKPNINFPNDAALFNTNVNGRIQLNANAQVINLGDPMVVNSALYGKQTNLGAAHQGANIIDFANNGAPVEATTSMDFETVFGLDKTQMKEFADTYIIDPNDPAAKNPLMDTEIRYIEGDISFDTSKPLFGNGMLIVEGDLSLSGIGHKFDGIIWVTGEVDIHAGGYIKGTVVAGTEATGQISLSVQGSSANAWFYVYFDPEAIDAINTKKFKYAMFRVPYVKKGAGSVHLTEDEQNLRTELILARYQD